MARTAAKMIAPSQMDADCCQHTICARGRRSGSSPRLIAAPRRCSCHQSIDGSLNARVLTYQVVALVEAIRKCWGQTSFQETPRLARWLFNTCYALVAAGVTFIQALALVATGPDPRRQAIINRIVNPR